ncbi:hypothetical protein BpHYR1_023732 [Brachionus plicatilis]|uniref:Uncharacterized protein n=1 Tax=Brachionus plicatilis TaxID=10195 RepID=A0A3M7RTB9_BRAPC|nr:hypothetical protein BpHYR1_023732 [Brachionus plicatilis]
MSVNSLRRIITRHKIIHDKDPKPKSDYKLAKPQQTSKNNINLQPLAYGPSNNIINEVLISLENVKGASQLIRLEYY